VPRPKERIIREVVNYLQLISALVICATLAYLSYRRGAVCGYARGLAAGKRESAGLARQQGYSDGVYEGRLKERLELDTFRAKATRTYEQGYEDALRDIAAMDATSASVPTIRLSA
jgi:hypothetical protein